MSVRRHALLRAASVSSSTIRDLERRRAMLGYDALSEIEQQVQIAINGTATATLMWTTATVDFNVSFAMAPEQRDSALTMPHFTYGVYVASAGASDDSTLGIAVQVNVRSWVRDADTRAVTGATVVIGAASGTEDTVEFSGYVHLSFQGFGAPTEPTPADLDIGT